MCRRIILNLLSLFMTFVQNQEIIMPENGGCITELVSNDFYKGLSHNELGNDFYRGLSHNELGNDFYRGLSHNELGPTGVKLFTYCSLLDKNVFFLTFIVCHGGILTMTIMHNFGL